MASDIATGRMSWDHAADHDLLSCLVKILNPTQENLRSVMEEMHGLGYTCTVKAITQHLQKLRRKDHSAGGGNDGSDGAAVPKTPRGRKPKAVKTPATTAGKRKTAAKVDPEDDDSEVEAKAPAKKQRVKKETPVKKEEQDEDDGGE
ncbi:hypothetical protein QBC44DRAFT_398890 [Cladorrhinum sp. PSN332]|nr:hypothetical protein QBC44DRAFT_398890 [Cladorrhinum sp. PSN332]